MTSSNDHLDTAPAGDIPVEIERKFVLHGMPALPADARFVEILQGYLPPRDDLAPFVRGRLRRTESDGSVTYTHTIKQGTGLVRHEIERDISAEEFDRQWPRTVNARIRKRRYLIPDGELEWCVDVFADLDLVLAEVELPDPETPSPPPAWLAASVDREVTEDRRYTNAAIARAAAEGEWGDGPG